MIMRLIIPEGYKPLITLKETEKILQMLKDHFEVRSILPISGYAGLLHHSLYSKGIGLNDDLAWL